MKWRKLKNTKDLVQTILEKDKQARNDDNYLYLRVLQTVAREEYQPHPHEITVELFLLNMSAFQFPPFESVRRSRQKIQAECPWLASCEKVSELRAENEEVYREFARS
ncbi:MAG: hypothetical protein IKB02_05345 [Clostridia bacterium]|nr:hypothetical protein [Clostridia bacterium]